MKNICAPEPLVSGTDKAGKVPLDVFDVVELGCEGILDIDDDDFPVGLSFIEKSHDAEDLDLLDLANIADLFADLANVERIVVTFGLGLCVELSRIFPSLRR
jgi:hypothetical protein